MEVQPASILHVHRPSGSMLLVRKADRRHSNMERHNSMMATKIIMSMEAVQAAEAEVIMITIKGTHRMIWDMDVGHRRAITRHDQTRMGPQVQEEEDHHLAVEVRCRDRLPTVHTRRVVGHSRDRFEEGLLAQDEEADLVPQNDLLVPILVSNLYGAQGNDLLDRQI
jgi:hypothetical protein